MIDTIYVNGDKLIMVSEPMTREIYNWLGITLMIFLLLILVYSVGHNNGTKKRETNNDE